MSTKFLHMQEGMCGGGHGRGGVHGRGSVHGGGHAWQEGGHVWQGGACMAGKMAIAAGSMHPTGMHSCFTSVCLS